MNYRSKNKSRNFLLDAGQIYDHVSSYYNLLPQKIINQIIQSIEEIILKRDFKLNYDDFGEKFLIERGYYLNINRKVPSSFVLIHSGNYEIPYNQKIIIKRISKFFDLFFAVKLFFIELLEVNDFLNYHLDHSFDGNQEHFKQFLEVIGIKYEKILGKKHNSLISIFNLKPEKIVEAPPNVKIVVLYLIIEELRLAQKSNLDKTKIADFIGTITNLNSGAKNNKNKNLYNNKIRDIENLMQKLPANERISVVSIFEELKLPKATMERIEIQLNKKKVKISGTR